MSHRRTLAATAALVLVLAGTACGGRQTETAATTSASAGAAVPCSIDTDTRIGIATGNATGVYYTLGNAYAEQLAAATDGKLKATAAETGASVQNIQQLVADQYQVAFSLFDTAADAVNGTGSFTEPQPVQALARIYDNYTHVIVRADAGVTGLADLKGKNVSTGSPKSGTEVIANRLLQAAGLNPDTDISAQRLDLTKSVDGLKDGTIDALIWSGGLPTPGITDLFTTMGAQVTFLDISPLLPKMQEINPAYQQATIAASVYQSGAEVPTIGVPNVLLVKDGFDANTACVLTRTLFDKQPELIQASAAAKGIDLQKAGDTAPVTLSSGAQAALDQLGAG
ncbi:MAG TPA: TAXI family TRAP transporter solute-binding subunit [Nakamurella sp.]